MDGEGSDDEDEDEDGDEESEEEEEHVPGGKRKKSATTPAAGGKKLKGTNGEAAEPPVEVRHIVTTGLKARGNVPEPALYGDQAAKSQLHSLRITLTSSGFALHLF